MADIESAPTNDALSSPVRAPADSTTANNNTAINDTVKIKKSRSRLRDDDVRAASSDATTLAPSGNNDMNDLRQVRAGSIDCFCFYRLISCIVYCVDAVCTRTSSVLVHTGYSYTLGTRTHWVPVRAGLP